MWSAGTTTGPDGYARPAAYHTVAGTTTTTVLELDWTAQWGRFLGIDGVGDDDLWAAGVLLGKASGTSMPLLAHWDGTGWQRVPIAGGAQGEWVAVRIADPMCATSRATVTALTVTAAAAWLGLRCGLTTDAREEGSVQVLHALAGSGFVPEPVAGDQPLFGVTVDPAGTAWAVGPDFGGSFGPPSAELWQRSG